MKSKTTAVIFLSCSLLLFPACEVSKDSTSGFNPIALKAGIPHSETTGEFQREFKFVPAGDFTGSVGLSGLSSNWDLYLFDPALEHESDFANGEFDLNEAFSSTNANTTSESISYSWKKGVTYYFVITEESGANQSSFTIAVN